jgi:ribosomal protein L24
MKKLKKWDSVKVISGKYKGKISTIEKTMDDYVVVKWVNVTKKAMKWKWFIKKTLPIHISNVMYYLEEKKIATKIWIFIDVKWKKIRKTKKFDLIIK